MFLKSTPKPQVFLQLGWSKPTGWGPTGWKAALQKSSWRAGAEHKAAVSPAARAASCIQGCICKSIAEGGGDSPLIKLYLEHGVQLKDLGLLSLKKRKRRRGITATC